MGAYQSENIYEILQSDYFSTAENTKNEFVWQTDVSMKHRYAWSRYYKMEIEDALFFSPRLKEARRWVDEQMLILWENATPSIDHDQRLDIANYINAMNEIVNIIHVAVQRLNECDVTENEIIESETTNFLEKREKKESFIICRYLISTSVGLAMELQEKYKPFILNKVKLYDIKSFFTNYVGRWPYKNIFRISCISKNKTEIPDNCCFKYESESFHEDIEILYETLIDYQLIDGNTDKKTVFDLFAGRGCLDKIQWIGSLGVLQAIIKEWVMQNTIEVYPCKIGHWQVVSKRFLDKDGSPMKTLGSEATIRNKTKNSKIIEDVVKALRKQ